MNRLCFPSYRLVLHIKVELWKYISCLLYFPIRKVRAAGQRNGGRNTYVTYCNTRQTDSIQDARNCVNKLPYVTGLAWGCVNAEYGNCKCTVDTSYQNDWTNTFTGAENNLFNECSNSIEAERYEGNMHLTYTCSQWFLTHWLHYEQLIFFFFSNKARNILFVLSNFYISRNHPWINFIQICINQW